MAQAAKPKAPPTYFARIPPQDDTAMPPRKAGTVRILNRTFTAGGKWLGPLSEKDAQTLREHRKPGCAPTFQVLPASKVKGLKGAPPKKMTREQVVAQVKALQDQLNKLQGALDMKEAAQREEAEEAALSEAKAEMGEPEPETGEGEAGEGEGEPQGEPEDEGASLDLTGGDPEAGTEETGEGEDPSASLDFGEDEAGAGEKGEDVEAPTAKEEVGGRRRSFATPGQHAKKKGRGGRKR